MHARTLAVVVLVCSVNQSSALAQYAGSIFGPSGSYFGGGIGSSQYPSSGERQVSAPLIATPPSAKAQVSLAIRDFPKIPEMPISMAVEFLQRYLGIPVVLDIDGLNKEGIEVDAVVSQPIEGLVSSLAVDMMLEKLDLDYFFRDEVMVVTTREAAIEMVYTDFVDIESIVVPESGIVVDPDDLKGRVLRAAITGEWLNEDGTLDPRIEIIGTTMLVSHHRRAHIAIQSFIERLNSKLEEQRNAARQRGPVIVVYRVYAPEVLVAEPQQLGKPEQPLGLGESLTLLNQLINSRQIEGAAGAPTNDLALQKSERDFANSEEFIAALKKTIMESIDPDSWMSGNDHAIWTIPGGLVVKNELQVQLSIKQLLSPFMVPDVNSEGLSQGVSRIPISGSGMFAVEAFSAPSRGGSFNPPRPERDPPYGLE